VQIELDENTKLRQERGFKSANMEPIRSKCVCDLFSWEDILGRGKAIGFSPFSAIKEGADSRCPLCSLLYGSLRVSNGPRGTTKLKADCPCTTENQTVFSIYGQSNFIIIEVSCGGDQGQTHLARLDLSTMPHNSLRDSPTSHG
jgi:hypothetical protein